MPLGRELLHIPVRAADDEQILGDVVDLVFEPNGRLTALVVAPSKGIFRTDRRIEVAAFSEITDCGAVLARREHFERRSDTDEEKDDHQGCRLRGGPLALCGRTILAEDGREIGTVGDVALEEVPGEGGAFQIWGFEVSDGALMDLLDGRSIVDGNGARLRDDSVVLTGSSHMNLRVEEHPSS